ncbi:hypothetical protein L218DRAFT_966210 [Marasmius fiardii PR-910]|nr:hypothetical protein L218DRAFT_966210 [Marasmius fiardii PR-910]
MSAFIPLDIVGHILELGDNATLSASCSLVCKSWTPISQSELFKRLYVRAENCGVKVARRTIHRPTQGTSIIHKIVRNTKIIQLTREICFIFQAQNSFRLTAHQYQSLTLLFKKLHGKLNRLERIRLDSEFLGVVGGDPVVGSTLSTSISTSFTNILDLKIRVYEENLGSLLRFACSFSNLKILAVDCYRALLTPGEAVCTSTLPLSLKSFRFHLSHLPEQTMNYYKSWLTSHPHREISHLSLGYHSFLGAQFYAPMCQTTLTTLQVGVEVGQFDGSFIIENHIHDLSSFQRLESITFIPSRSAGIKAVVPTLSSLNSLALRKVTLILDNCYRNRSEFEAATDEFVSLNKILAAPRFSRTVLEIRNLPDSSFASNNKLKKKSDI